MSRRLYLDDAPGERRGVVTLDGRPEWLLIERSGRPELPAGTRAAARIRRIERGLGLAFVDLGQGGEAVLSLSAPTRVVEGELVEVEVAAPARQGKAAVVRCMAPATGGPGPLAPLPDLAARLRAIAPGALITAGPNAREAADGAEAEVLAVEHALPGGARISIERTRALVAVDVDVGAAGAGDTRRSQAKVNHLALRHTARLLRLKGLGGLVVIDLAGRGRDGPALAATAHEAFAPDMPGVVVAGVSRLGVLELAIPWRSRPVAEVLNDPADPPAASLSALTVALRLARAIEREAGPGLRVSVRCAPDVAAAFQGVAPALRERLGSRFAVEADPALGREFMDLTTR